MQRSGKGQLFTDIVLDVFKLSGLLIASGDELTKDLGMTSARWKVLGALDRAGSPMTVSQIAHSMGQTRQGVQRLSDAMEKAGILAYRKNPLHKKAKLVAMTAKGETVFRQMELKQIPWANGMAKEIDVADMKVTIDVLRKMIEKLET